MRFFVGFDDILPEQNAAAVAPATELGASALRYTLQWAPGESGLAASDVAAIHAGVSAGYSMRIVLSVYGRTSAAPADATGRSQYCSFVADALRLEPRIRDVVIWNEPNKAQFWSPQRALDGSAAAPAAYEALLESCYDSLHAAYPGVNILGLALSSGGSDDVSGTSPGAFIRDVGMAYRSSGRRSRILDTVAFHPYPVSSLERPWAKHVASKMIGEGDWNKLMYNLWLAFNGTPQPVPGQEGVTIWYTELGFQTTVPAPKRLLYFGAENVPTLAAETGGETVVHPAESTAAPDQATQVGDAIALAACQPFVGAMFNFLIADEASLVGWQSGALYRDLTKKASFAAFQQAIGAAVAGTVDCADLKGGEPSPDYSPPSAPTSLSASPSTTPLSVTLSWSAATDDQSAIAYRIYRGSTQVGVSSTTTWTDSTVSGNRNYVYTVRAIDAASNLGTASDPARVTMPS